MNERATKWSPISDIDSVFGSISYSYSQDSLVVTMLGDRNLSLHFSKVIAVRYEDECPGFDPLPHPLPMLRPAQTFPLLVIEQSQWLKKFELIHPGRTHFALVSSDDLIQILATPDVVAKWK